MDEIWGYVYEVHLKNKNTGETQVEKIAIGRLPKQKQVCMYLITEEGVIPMAYFTSESAAKLLVYCLCELTNNKEAK